MKKIVPLYIICFLLALLSHRNSDYSYRLGRYKHKEHFFYSIMVLSVIIFAGLRRGYNDTWAYLTGFDLLDISEGWISRISWSVGDVPLYSFLIHVMKKAGLSSQSYILVCSAFIYGTFLWFVHKYTKNVLLTVFLFFTTGCFAFALAAIKQCMATAFCLIGIDRLLNGKRIRFLFWITVGVLFHPFSAMFYICPLLLFSPWRSSTYMMIAGFGVLGYTFQRWLGSAINALTVIGIEYDPSLLAGEGVNVFRVLALWAPILLSFVAAKHWRQSQNRADNLMMNLSILCAELMFIALFGNPIYIGRLANFFLIFQVISLPIILNCFEENSRILLSCFVVIGYSGFSIYSNLFSGTTFDSEFGRITLFRYLRDLF